MMTNPIDKQIVDLIRRSQKILVLPSAPADGDSIGSSIALYLALKKLNKEVTVVSSEAVPEVLQFLPNVKIVGNKMVTSNDFVITLDCRHVSVENIKHEIVGDKVNIIITPKEGRLSEENISFNKGQTDFDLIITVDTAELTQLKDFYENNVELFHQIPVINIDHHISNTHFGRINHVDIMSSATTEMLLPILELLGHEENVQLIDEDVATLLLTGIITDTGSFQNANTTPKSFAKAAQLISYGARQQEIIQHIYKTKQLSQLKLWGRVLSKIQTDEEYRIVWSVVTQQDFRDTESSTDQTGDVIDELMSNAPGAEVIFLMKEKGEGVVSVSVRTTSPSVDAAKIAENFGGGGHTQAAGFTMHGTNVLDAEYQVINYIREYQSERLGLINKIERAVAEEDKPLINVEELMQMAEEAQMATEMISKVEHKEKKKKKKFEPQTPPQETQTPETTDSSAGYKFED